MRDVLVTAAKQLAETWTKEAAGRFTPPVVAEALNICASELVAEIERVDRETRLVTVEQYAKAHGTTASTVRRWCVRHQLEATKSEGGDWMIPRNARRMKATG